MKPDDTIQEPSFELVASNQSAAMLKSEISAQVEIAKAYPRQMSTFVRRASSMATIDEETAESCLFRRPVGKDQSSGQMKYAEGMSVRMAEIVGACYGNLRVYATIIEQTERQVICRGMAIDLESNFASSSEVIESTVKRDGRPYDERMRAVIAKAALAKARRDATFQVVPRALAKPIEQAVRKVISGDAITIQKRREKVLSWINTIGIEAGRVWAALNVKGVEDLTSDHLETLTGIRTALRDGGETSIDEAFPIVGAAKQTGTPGGTGNITKAVEEKKPELAKEKPAETVVVEETDAEKFKRGFEVLGIQLQSFVNLMNERGYLPDNAPKFETIDELLKSFTPKLITFLLKNLSALNQDLQLQETAKPEEKKPEQKEKPAETVTAPAPAQEQEKKTESEDTSTLGLLRKEIAKNNLTEEKVISWGKDKKKIPASVQTLEQLAEVSPTTCTYLLNNFPKIVKELK